jgi:hypothetical protein
MQHRLATSRRLGKFQQLNVEKRKQQPAQSYCGNSNHSYGASVGGVDNGVVNVKRK